MTAADLRRYWCHKYQISYNEKYDNTDFIIELAVLKRLISKYDKYLLLEAIDNFLSTTTRDRAVIKFFGSKKSFENRFKTLINLQPIIKYQRLLLSFPQNVRDEVKALIEEYKDYSTEVISDSEKIRKKEIIEQLNQLEKEYLNNEI